MDKDDRPFKNNKEYEDLIDKLTQNSRKKEATVTAKCISCEAEREIKAGEITKGDFPTCHKCGMVMIAHKAEVK